MVYHLAFSILFSLVLTSHSSHSFPVHHIRNLKDVTPQVENREDLLCWTVHIMTHSQCDFDQCEIDDSAWGNRNSLEIKAKRCGCRKQSEQHANEIASELDLVVVRIFREFSDHFLLCHISDKNDILKASPRQLNISSIYYEHATFKSQSADAFFQLKREIERELSSHDEIVRFSQEFAFRRHSRWLSNGVSHDTYHSHQSLRRFQNDPNVKSGYTIPVPVNKTTKENSPLTFLIDLLGNIHEVCHLIQSVLRVSNHISLTPKSLKIWNDVLKNHENSNSSLKAFTTVVHHCCRFLSENPASKESYFQRKVYRRLSLSEIQCCLPSFCTLLSNLSKCLISHLDGYDNHHHHIYFNNSRYFKFEKYIHGIISFLAKRIQFMKRDNSLEFEDICKKILRLSTTVGASNSFFTDLVNNLQRGCLVNERVKQRENYVLSSIKQNSMKQEVSSDVIQMRRSRQGVLKQPPIASVSMDEGKQRVRRSAYQDQGLQFNDPAFPHQWHLRNLVTHEMDINVTGVWANNVTGQGVTVAVVDDGVEWRNPDIKGNYNYHGSWDLNDDDPDPSPSTKKIANHHGTRCAGEIAAVANNKVCGVGVAYKSQISGLRVLDGIMTDSLEADAFNKKMDINDIYSCSWGPDDDGMTVDGPHLMAAKAMKHGVDFGRKGYGSIFVVASGNGGSQHDNCNYDGYANSIYTVTIGAVDESGSMPYYAEECASMLGVTFSSGLRNKRDIVTTDWMFKNSKGCTENHTGTSAAAPLAAGMIALMLSARSCLTWRDVQYILILTAKKVDVDVAHWQKNGAGLIHSHKHGFGLLNAWRIVNAARIWKSVPWMTSFSYTSPNLNSFIPKGTQNPLILSHFVREEDIRGYGLSVLESVQVTIWLTHPCRGKLGIKLTSPRGTVSVIAAPRPKDNSSAGFQGWTFTTVRNWGEGPIGNWTLKITDKDVLAVYDKGRLTQWRLTLFGTPMTPEEFQERRHLVESAMGGQFLSSNHTLSCPPPPQYKEEPSFLSEKTLKILALASAFCVVMALYETMEYLCCYDEEKEGHYREMRLARRALLLAEQTSVTNNSVNQSPSEFGEAPTVDSHSSRNNLSADFRNEDDDDEDDIFDASETQLLLSSSSRNSVENAHRSLNSPQVNGDNSQRLLNNTLSSEAIPLSTFSVSSSNMNAGAIDSTP